VAIHAERVVEMRDGRIIDDHPQQPAVRNPQLAAGTRRP
jgi:hypothetical protein